MHWCWSFLSCPGQLNRWLCHSLTHSVTFWFWHFRVTLDSSRIFCRIVTIIDNSNKDNSAWWGDLTWPKKALRCCDIWDTDYNTDNWEPEFMTIFVIWQLIVTLDSIRNSCDVSRYIQPRNQTTWKYWPFNFLFKMCHWCVKWILHLVPSKNLYICYSCFCFIS